jgi:6-phosphogluconate dehydrogenase
MAELAQIGVTGLAVMGRNLARNFARHGHRVAIHNRSYAKTESLLADHGDDGTFIASETMADFVASLERPRRVIVMVKAGPGTDAVIAELVPLLEEGDIVIDAGNAHFPDTIRREAELKEHGLHFVGSGVSGGEEGALNGPSIMPGGSRESYKSLGPLLEDISAKVDGEPCCTYVGPDGAGHYVKMVHNGIEYADMQLIAEAYDLIRQGTGASAAEIAKIFSTWNEGPLESFLIEITADVLGHVDAETGQAFVDIVLDQAEQKGTGRWTVQNALDLGVPITGIAEATFARALSGSVPQREAARGRLPAGTQEWNVSDRDAFVEDVRQALYASKVVAYSQGFDQIAAASKEYDWDIDRGAMARIWRGGCIIRARFLNRITEAYEREPDLPLLLADDYFVDVLNDSVAAWRRVVAGAAQIQAQRDFFGAHTYRRVDNDGIYHTEWSLDRSETNVDPSFKQDKQISQEGEKAEGNPKPE